MLNWKYGWEVLFSTLQNWKHSLTKLPSARCQPAQSQSPLQSGQREDRRERVDKHPQLEKKQAFYFWGGGVHLFRAESGKPGIIALLLSLV